MSPEDEARIVTAAVAVLDGLEQLDDARQRLLEALTPVMREWKQAEIEEGGGES